MKITVSELAKLTEGHVRIEVYDYNDMDFHSRDLHRDDTAQTNYGYYNVVAMRTLIEADEYGGARAVLRFCVQEDPNRIDAEDEEGICPLCGGDLSYTGSHDMDDTGGKIPWTCPMCGASGKEGYNRVFDRHYDVTDKKGNPIPGRAE